ncbi:MAG: hypothetical protein J6A73_01710 [Lachnospiraceae bacterium]|nr:hypothetical protein [Lachnospiraceae bacterium]
MDKILSIRKNKQLISLFIKIQEYQKSANRTEIINCAIKYALKNEVNWSEVEKNKISECDMDYEKIPEFLQFRVDYEEYKRIVSQIRKTFKLEKDSPVSYVAKLLLINYLSYVESDEFVGEENVVESILYPVDEMLEEFKKLPSIDDKLNAIYELLLKSKIKR